MENKDAVEKHFPHTAKLIHNRAVKSESPARDRSQPAQPDTYEDVDGAASDDDHRGQLDARLEKAAARRERLLEERRKALAEATAVRAAKLQQVSAMRKVAVLAFMDKAPALLRNLAAAGLDSRGVTLQLPEVVEHILMADPRVCSVCEKPPLGRQLPQACPQTKKPHRRSLVVLAESLLKLIGNTKVNLSPPKIGEPSLDSTPAAPAAKTKRGITVLPHLFVLAYYYASLRYHQSHNATDVDPLLQENAVHLIEIVDQLSSVLRSGDPNAEVSSDEDTVHYVSELLGSFAKTWRQYAKLADTSNENANSAEGRRKVVEELVQSTTDAFVAARVKIALGQASDGAEQMALSAFLQVLLTRLQEVGGPSACEGALQKADARVSQALADQQHSLDAAKTPRSVSVSANTTPETTPSKPPVAIVPAAPLSHYATSSDTDGASAVSHGSSEGESCRTQQAATPPEVTEAQRLRERREKLELRARTAFQAKLKLTDAPSETEAATERVLAALRESAFAKLAADLNSNPPNLDRIPSALTAVADALLEALPKRLRSRIGREIKDVLDWSTVRRSVRNSEQHIADLMKYVVGRVIELGAPAREAELRVQADEWERRLDRREEQLGDIVAGMFRFMLEAIRQLRQDISAFTLTMISKELVERAEEYHAEFLAECLPPRSQWTHTLSFLRHHVLALDESEDLTAQIARQLQDSLPVATAFTAQERVARAVVYSGILDLLRSAKKTPEMRWALFPSEALSVEKQQIFQCANTVQQDTLRLFVSGTASMLIQPKRPRQPSVLQAYITSLDAKLCSELLPKAESLEVLQAAICSDINQFLSDEANFETPCLLSDSEVAVLNGMVAKMTDTQSQQYATFEARVMGAVQAAFLMDPKEAASVPVAQRPRTVGLVSESAFKCGANLRLVVDYHWTVLRPLYLEMMSVVAPSATGGAQTVASA